MKEKKKREGMDGEIQEKVQLPYTEKGKERKKDEEDYAHVDFKDKQ